METSVCLCFPCEFQVRAEGIECVCRNQPPQLSVIHDVLSVRKKHICFIVGMDTSRNENCQEFTVFMISQLTLSTSRSSRGSCDFSIKTSNIGSDQQCAPTESSPDRQLRWQCPERPPLCLAVTFGSYFSHSHISHLLWQTRSKFDQVFFNMIKPWH